MKDNRAEDIRNMSDDEILLAWFIIIKSWEDESTREHSPVGRWEKEWYQDCIYFEVQRRRRHNDKMAQT